MEPGGFYLILARHALERLRATATAPEGGGWVFAPEAKHTDPSPHFEYAVTCTVFSAFAVEYELSRLIALRSALQIRVDRRALDVRLSRRPNREQLSRFLRAATNLPASVDDEIWQLMRRRDRFAHAQIVRKKDRVVRKAILPGQNPLIERELRMPQITWKDVEVAPKSLEVAERLVPILRGEITNPDWEAGIPS